MMTTIKTFRGYMVSTYDGALENAKKMLSDLISDDVAPCDRWCQWWDEKDYVNTLTPYGDSLKLTASKTIFIDINIPW